MQEPEQSWRFDPATERSAALANNPHARYLLLDATQKDIQKTIALYERCPVPGYEIASVQTIYNSKFNTKFQIHLQEQQDKKGNPAFVPKWSSMANAPLRQQIDASFKKISQPYTDPSYLNVAIIPAWHGTKSEILDSIFKIGYSNLAFTDSGFFGKGLYSAYEAKYAYQVYFKGALILNWVACFSALPVVDGDMPLLTGKGNYGSYDAHFIPVVPANPNNPDEQNFFPCKAGQTPKYNEIVVFQTAACLPRFLVTLQSTLLKSIPVLKNTNQQAVYIAGLQLQLSALEKLLQESKDREVKKIEDLEKTNLKLQNQEEVAKKLQKQLTEQKKKFEQQETAFSRKSMFFTIGIASLIGVIAFLIYYIMYRQDASQTQSESFLQERNPFFDTALESCQQQLQTALQSHNSTKTEHAACQSQLHLFQNIQDTCNNTLQTVKTELNNTYSSLSIMEKLNNACEITKTTYEAAIDVLEKNLTNITDQNMTCYQKLFTCENDHQKPQVLQPMPRSQEEMLARLRERANVR